MQSEIAGSLAALAASLEVLVIGACMVRAEGYDHPAGDPKGSRSVVMAPNGIVATSHPLASQVGIDVLKHGGNAIDAAIAANATLGVVEPMMCGVGGDLFAIVWDAKTQKLYGLNASGRSPYAATRDVFAKRGLAQIPAQGPLTWSVPGCVDGWDQLRRRFGTKGWSELLAGAIEYAERGFPVSEITNADWQDDESLLARWADSARTFLPTGRAPKAGELFRNPNLAATYRLIAVRERDEFYRGSIADKIVAYSQASGGLFAKKDFEDHTSTWVEPVSTTYRGYEVWELPPNGQGIAVLQMLNILEGYDLKSLGHNSAEYLHLLIEAKKLAFADRAKFYADPDFGRLPVAELVSKQYAARRRKLIDPSRARPEVPAGDVRLSAGETTYLTVIDKGRNCVSLIQSNFHSFGSGMVPGDLGFVLQNRGNLFSLDAQHLNRLEPHKRPFHTIIPGFVTKSGKPYLSFGVMGGDMQPQGHVQVLLNIIDFGMNVQQAGDAARFRHNGADTPTGGRMTDGGVVSLETGIGEDVRERLRRKGHRLGKNAPGQYGGYQAILIDPDTNMLHGASEPRKDGAAIGY